MEWDELDPEPLFSTIREEAPAADAERMIWALEHILAAGRIDPILLDHFAAAAVCGLAYRDGETPRTILAQLARRSIDDEAWQREYAQLLPPSAELH